MIVNEKVEILGVEIDNVNLISSLEIVSEFLKL